MADEGAPAAFDEEDATRRAKKMKVDELRAALEAAGVEDTEGTKPALVERLVAAQRAAASPQPMEEDSDADAPMEARNGRGSGDEAEEAEAAPNAFDEEEATRRAKKMKVEELRAALEAAGEDTEGTKPVLVERAVAAARAAAEEENSGEYGEEGYDSDEGYPVEEGDEIAVGARLLGKFSGDGRYYDCVVEEVTENGYVVLFTEYDEREELSREHLRYYAAEDDSCAGDDEGYFVEEVVEGAELLGRKSDDGQYHNVMVEEVTEAGCKVLFTEFGDDEQNRAELPVEHLRYPYAAEEEEGYDAEDGYYDDSNDEAIAAGAELSGKFSGDGLYYDVVVEEVTENGYQVLFPGGPIREELPREHLRPRPTAGDEFRWYDEEGGYYDEQGHYYDAEGNQYVVTEEDDAALAPVAEEEGDEVGYFVEEGHDVAVGNVLLGRKSDDGQYYNCVVEEVTETGYKVLFTEHEGEDGAREELPREHLRYYYAADDDDEPGYPVEEGHEIAVGNNLLGKSDGQYYDVIVEEVTETGYKVLFTASGDRGELPRERLRFYDGDEDGYFVEAGAAIAVGAELLGRKSDDGQYCDCVVEEVTETGCKVLFTAYDDGEEIRAELPREHLRIAYPYEEGDDDDDDEEGDEEGYFVGADGIPVGAELLGRKSDDGQYYDVVIEEVTDTGYRVLFTAYEGEDGDREELPIEHLRYYYPDEEGDGDDDDEEGYEDEEGDEEGLFVEDGVDGIAVGAELLGRWSEDGEYYDCVVEEVTETGYRVLFTAYEGEDGDRAELPREHLRIPYLADEEGDEEEGDEAEEPPAAAPDAEDEPMADEDEEEDGPTFRVGDAVVDGKTGEVGQVVGKVPGWWKIRIPSSDQVQSRREKDLTAAGEDEEGDDDIEVGAELLGRWSEDGEFYDCVVEEVTETGYVVLFTEYGDREELTIDDLRWYDDEEEEEDGYSIESSDEIEVGAELLGKYSDGFYYDCVVEEVTENGYQVLFTEYDEREELAREHLRYYADEDEDEEEHEDEVASYEEEKPPERGSRPGEVVQEAPEPKEAGADGEEECEHKEAKWGGPLTEGGHDDPRADTTPRDDHGRRLKGSRLLEYMDQGPLGADAVYYRYRRGPPEEDVEELQGAAVNEALRIPAWPPAPLVPLSNEEYNQRPEQPSSEYENCEGDFAEGDEDRTVELWDPSDDKKRKSRTERELPSIMPNEEGPRGSRKDDDAIYAADRIEKEATQDPKVLALRRLRVGQRVDYRDPVGGWGHSGGVIVGEVGQSTWDVELDRGGILRDVDERDLKKLNNKQQGILENAWDRGPTDMCASTAFLLGQHDHNRASVPVPERLRCFACEGCLATPCGECAPCKDDRANGGPGKLRRVCVRCRCKEASEVAASALARAGRYRQAPQAPQILEQLEDYLQNCGGSAGSADGWTIDVVERKGGETAGGHDVYYFPPDGGKRCRSRAEVARALGLQPAKGKKYPSKSKK